MKEAKSALNYAKTINANSDFYKSCKKFYEDRGYLTEKQIDALWNFNEEAYEYHIDPLWDFGDR